MRASCLSDIGKIRSNNEDKVLMDIERGIFLLADGMGGCNGGEIASDTAVDAAYRFLCSQLERTALISYPALLSQAMTAAHSAVLNRSAGNPFLEGMGTTLDIMVLKKGTAFISHVGDSRVYLLRDNELRRLTIDDNLAASLMENQHVAEHDVPPQARHILTQAIGASDLIVPQLVDLQLRDGDLFILCSDGLTGMLADAEIFEIAGRFTDDPDSAVGALVGEANARGGNDNVSVLLVALGPLLNVPH